MRVLVQGANSFSNVCSMIGISVTEFHCGLPRQISDETAMVQEVATKTERLKRQKLLGVEKPRVVYSIVEQVNGSKDDKSMCVLTKSSVARMVKLLFWVLLNMSHIQNLGKF